MDEARKRILERRARFVAAAIATLGTTSCKERQPQVCLSAVPEEYVDSSAPAASTSEPDAAAAQPMPCLKPVPPPRDAGPAPAVCLSMIPPKTKST